MTRIKATWPDGTVVTATILAPWPRLAEPGDVIALDLAAAHQRLAVAYDDHHALEAWPAGSLSPRRPHSRSPKPTTQETTTDE